MGPIIVSKNRRRKQYKTGKAVNGVADQRRVFESYGNKSRREIAALREKLGK
jgi:hypothetical protein